MGYKSVGEFREVYDQDDERAQKKMDKFKKSILRMKEDVND